MSEILAVIDGNSLMHRAFYALPQMKNSKGQNTGAIYGFINMLLKITEEYSPDYIAVAFDKKGKTFRHEIYSEYKAGRRETPPELVEQLETIRKVLIELGVAIVEESGFEADDFLGAISKQAEREGIKAFLITGDRDAFQLITDNVSVLFTKKGISEIDLFDKAGLMDKYGIEPYQVVSLKALMGDASDHIPGVPGIGEKTALKLLSEYKTVDELYDNIDKLPKNKVREKLKNNRESAFLSKKLATIETDFTENIDMKNLEFRGFDNEKTQSVLSDLEFASILKRMGIDRKVSVDVSTVEVNDINVLKEILKELSGKKAVAVYEADSAIYFSTDANTEFKVNLDRTLFCEGISYDDFVVVSKTFFESDTPKILFDQKRFMKNMHEYGVHINNCVFDVLIAEYVLNPASRKTTLEKLKGSDIAGFAAALITISEKQKEKVEALGLQKILYEIEFPLIKVLFDMEKEGFKVDINELRMLEDDYGKKLDVLTGEIYELCGEEFNIASPKQLGAILFEKLGLPSFKKTKTGYSTDSDVLEKLLDKHPVIEKIIEYRQLSKLKNTYVDGLLKIASKTTSKVYTTFQQTATVTGRISSTEPNLQNIPIRTEMGRDIRRVFIPTDEKRVILSADYSQIELRVLAHISNDDHMIDAFLHGEDIHARTASEVFKVPLDEVTSEMRSSAKAVNFGIVYGISDFGLSRNLNIPVYRAGEYINSYLAEFSGVREYMKNIVEEAKKNGYVKTLWGRIRYIDELKSPNYNIRSFGERAALNTPIQGTAADIIKYAMIKVYEELESSGLKSRLILQVHDELIIDAYEDELEKVSGILKDCMENACSLKVPLDVDIACGKNWADAK